VPNALISATAAAAFRRPAQYDSDDAPAAAAARDAARADESSTIAMEEDEQEPTTKPLAVEEKEAAATEEEEESDLLAEARWRLGACVRVLCVLRVKCVSVKARAIRACVCVRRSRVVVSTCASDWQPKDGAFMHHHRETRPLIVATTARRRPAGCDGDRLGNVRVW
jgi:hypothetical protein